MEEIRRTDSDDMRQKNRDANRTRGSRRAASRALAAVGVLAYVMAGAIGCWLMETPRWFTARVLGELGPQTSAVGGGPANHGGGQGSRPLSHEERVAVEAAVFRSTEVLGRVVEQHKLVERWNLPGPEEAVAKLRSMVTIAAEPGTDLVRLEIVSTDRHESAHLANDVGNSFFRHGDHRGTLWEMATVPRHSSAPNVRGWGLMAGLLATLGMGALVVAWTLVRP